MIEVRNLTKRYGERTILQGISLEVEPGEILAIMGSSGGGKTTLLKCIAGLTDITEGSVIVDDVDVSKDPEAARARLGLVFQSSALFDFMNVADNVLFGVRRRERKLTEARERELLDDLLEGVGLIGTEEKMPSELSGGMRKRVGLARALALEPHAVLYDEPTTGLDPITAYTIDRMIVETCQRRNVASLVVSHDVSSVFRVAHRVAFLEAGELTFLGTPDEFGRAERPAIRELVQKAQATTLELSE